MSTTKEIRAMLASGSGARVCEAFTDGGCVPNPGYGGWGVVLRIGWHGMPIELCGGASDTTNNRMEMTAALQALRAVPEGWAIKIKTDSRYLLDGFTKWMPAWKRRGWMRKDRRTGEMRPVLNDHLWRALDQAARGRAVSWEWVRGHAGNEFNELADRLATQGRANHLAGISPDVDLDDPIFQTGDDIHRAMATGNAQGSLFCS